MAAITHQKYDEREAIYRLVGEYLSVLSSEERMGYALALSERLMQKMTVGELREWRQGLERNKAKGW